MLAVCTHYYKLIFELSLHLNVMCIRTLSPHMLGESGGFSHSVKQ